MNNRRGSYRNNSALIGALLVVVTVLTGCTPRAPAGTHTAQTIVVPTTAVWSADHGSQLWSEEQSDGISVLYELVASTQTRTAVHRSRQPMSSIASSFDGLFLSFMQNSDLFVVMPEKGAVHRVMEQVISYTWSPSRAALITHTATQTTYIEIEPDGSVAQTTVLRDGEPLYGAAFLDGKTVIGFQRAEDGVQDGVADSVELVSYDLRAVAPTIITTWQRPLVLAKDVASLTLEITENHDVLTVTERATDNTQATSRVRYRFSTNTYEDLPLANTE